MSEGDRTILVTTEDREFQVGGIPADAKITYGGLRPDQPGTKTNTLRIYAGLRNQNQLAVFRDVISFRDMTLIISDSGPVKKEWM